MAGYGDGLAGLELKSLVCVVVADERRVAGKTSASAAKGVADGIQEIP